MPCCNVSNKIHPLGPRAVAKNVKLRLLLHVMRLVLDSDPPDMVALDRSELIHREHIMYVEGQRNDAIAPLTCLRCMYGVWSRDEVRRQHELVAAEVLPLEILERPHLHRLVHRHVVCLPTALQMLQQSLPVLTLDEQLIGATPTDAFDENHCELLFIRLIHDYLLDLPIMQHAPVFLITILDLAVQVLPHEDDGALRDAHVTSSPLVAKKQMHDLEVSRCLLRQV
mmetsp:Transcript_56119/g.162549  ORF Transcript_56119/g.162549 Transcript_56119/m.162549 type:complete len:226 (+) Transcript_56119:2123-2800(+)